METVRALKGRYGDRRLAVMKTWLQDNSESWKKLATAWRWMTRYVVPLMHKGQILKGPGWDNVPRKAPKGWKPRMLLVKTRINNCTRNWELRSSYVWGWRGNPEGLQEDCVAGDPNANSWISNWCSESECLDIVEVKANTQAKEDDTSRLRAKDVWTQATLSCDNIFHD